MNQGIQRTHADDDTRDRPLGASSSVQRIDTACKKEEEKNEYSHSLHGPVPSTAVNRDRSSRDGKKATLAGRCLSRRAFLVQVQAREFLPDLSELAVHAQVVHEHRYHLDRGRVITKC